MVNDIISDMLTKLRNANMVKHRIVRVPKTKMSIEIAKILEEEGFIISYQDCYYKNKHYLILSLKYIGKSRIPVISNIKRISKPGLRVYVNSKKLPKILNNLGIAILSTSKGLMTNLKAKELGIGGELICYIW